MRVYNPSPRCVTPTEVFAIAIAHCQKVFAFHDAVACTALMLWSVLAWAAARVSSLAHAVDRLYPGTQDQTFWNLLRAHLPKQVPALERRLNELLRLPWLLPKITGRPLILAIDYHAIPYYGRPKKVIANCVVASPNAARPGSTSTLPYVSWWPVGDTPWR
jgi:hypothetical protein